jgi:hypothetical protein
MASLRLRLREEAGGAAMTDDQFKAIVRELRIVQIHPGGHDSDPAFYRRMVTAERRERGNSDRPQIRIEPFFRARARLRDL